MRVLRTNYRVDYPSLCRGVVESNEDPKNLGRCKVRVPSVHGALTYPIDILPWARPLVLSPVGSGRGSVNIPEIGDIVWVLFEGSNKEFPVYFGGTYAIDDLEIDRDIIDFYTNGEDSIRYDKSKREYTISVGETNLSISPNGITADGLAPDIDIELDYLTEDDIDNLCDTWNCLK